jgi:hypothetical protein
MKSHAIPGLQEAAAQRIDAALRDAVAGTQGCEAAVKAGLWSGFLA